MIVEKTVCCFLKGSVILNNAGGNFRELASQPLKNKEWHMGTSRNVNVLALVKGKERYIFIYGDESRAETSRCLGRFAANPDLSFTWCDAAVLLQRIRQEAQNNQARQPLQDEHGSSF